MEQFSQPVTYSEANTVTVFHNLYSSKWKSRLAPQQRGVDPIHQPRRYQQTILF